MLRELLADARNPEGNSEYERDLRNHTPTYPRPYQNDRLYPIPVGASDAPIMPQSYPSHTPTRRAGIAGPLEWLMLTVSGVR